ncbi:MAG: RNA polymerase subunit sigma-70 [Rubrivivax sp.]|nr:MAG: RNA polymerase subunit sigma-70 [Rubrivivax sp.]
MNLQDPEERAAATGEYVLGTLGQDDHAAFSQALAQSPALQAEVYAWQDRLLNLSKRAAPLSPRAQLWQRIDATLGAMAAVALPPRSSGPARLPWWQRLGWWQGLSGLAVAASVVMAALLVQRGGIDPTGDRYLAMLQSPQDQTTAWVVEIRAGGTLRLRPVSDMGVVPAGRSLQFWTKMPGAAGPTSLGLVKTGQALELPVSRLPGVGQQQLFEITLEPENGSPIGRPTGPILYVGRTIAL